MLAKIAKLRGRVALSVPPSTGAREALQWLMFARLGLAYVLLAAVVLQEIFQKGTLVGKEAPLSYALLGISFGFNLVSSLLIERVGHRWSVGALHILFDAAVTSAWIFYSTSREQLFPLLYLIQILLVALIFFQKGAWFSAILSSLFFGLVLWARPGSASEAWISWSVFSGIFLTVGIVGGYLSEELLRTSQSLKEKQRKIEKVTALHESILNNLPTGLLTVDKSMRVNFLNPAAEHILGKRSDEIVGQDLSVVEPDLMPFFSQILTENIPDEPESGADPSQKIEAPVGRPGTDHHRSYFVQASSPKGAARLQQIVEVGTGKNQKILRGDVAALDPEAGLGKLLDAEDVGARVLLFQDVTKLLHLEDRLKQNEKLAAVGQLAAGIAHEIRNPLASMSASIEMLKASFPPSMAGGENQKLMDIAIREIDRLNRLITEFLDFVKPDRFKRETVALDKVLSDLVVVAKNRADVRAKIEIREHYEGEALAQANPEKLKQVIWNLLVNAIQAMDRKGSIEVGCSRLGQGQVKFWVTDEGKGMSDEVMAHLYEPFFTTKDKGTGLGLATVYKIVEAHHGEIKVFSQVDKGTRFEVYLPRAA